MYGESFYEIIFRASVNRNKIHLDFSHSECYIYYTWNYASTWIALQLLILLINVTNFYKIHAVFSLSWINPHLCFSAVTLGTTPLWAGHWGPTCQLNWALKPPGGRVWRSWRGLWRAWTLPVTGSVCLISTPLPSAPHRTSASRPTWATQSVCPSLCPFKIRVWHILFRPLNSHFPVVFFFCFISGGPDHLPAAGPVWAQPPPHTASDPPGISEDRKWGGQTHKYTSKKLRKTILTLTLFWVTN